MYELKVARFGLYPADEPSSYVVGFSATAANGRSVYRDTTVSLKDAEGLSDDEIVNLAWIQLGPGIEQEMEVQGAKSPLVGQTWEPSEETKAAVDAAIAASKVTPIIKEL